MIFSDTVKHGTNLPMIKAIVSSEDLETVDEKEVRKKISKISNYVGNTTNVHVSFIVRREYVTTDKQDKVVYSFESVTDPSYKCDKKDKNDLLTAVRNILKDFASSYKDASITIEVYNCDIIEKISLLNI